jgi:hypothetical protein
MKSTPARVPLTLALLVALLLVPASFSQNGEAPPYDPAPLSDGMTTFTNQDLAITVLYPKEFQPKTPMDLQTVMERGHRLAFGTDPKGDSEHSDAVRCMHTLLYATSGSPTDSGTPQSSESASFDSILLEDVDVSCVPKKLKGDKALTNLVGTVLNLPNSTQLVQQMWFVAGGDRHIHSGMAATMLRLAQPSTGSDQKSPPPSVPLFVIAAGVEQKGHRILIVYLSGTSQEKHDAVPHMSIAFEDGRPVLLFPFLLGRTNLIK